ncbi:RNI-like protein [Dendrothele bispora CBS 962.96]|uniref:RNI-like protein n=1 Tax=Dendrothele bispora (strain CBS 962.96) TaxID=1314807 RepID=A0A4S8LZV3_DENBC|nr:RNI-like protein [Dendrothele bispora CBS 962.96]
MIPKIFAMLRGSPSATYLPHEYIVTYFLQGPSLTLTDSLPGVNKNTILAIGRVNPHLRELELSGFVKHADEVFASVVSHLKSLRSLVLRGCTRVGAKTADAITKACPELRILNLNYTSVTPLSVGALVASCHQLEVLKLANISNWTDATFTKFLAALDEKACLPKLHTLKLRDLSLSDNSLSAFISLCPALERLDLSFTPIKHPQTVLSTNPPALEKLSLTSTAITGTELLATLVQLPHLKTLSLGALGVRQSSKAAISNSSAMSMNDTTLRSLTDILEGFEHLQSVNLVSNTKLGASSKVDSALFDFVRRVGRKCQYLNLSNLPSIRSIDFAALLPLDEQDTAPSLRTLVLNNLNINDDAAVFIACCRKLSRLELSGTKMTSKFIEFQLNVQ